MPGKIRKARTGIAKSNSAVRQRPVSRSLAARPKVAPRVKTNVARRATNVKRSQNRIVKRQAAQITAAKTQTRPRPVVRPSSRPIKRMPKVPAPPTPGLQSMRKPAAPSVSIPISRARRPGATAAFGAAAAGSLLALNVARAHPEISTGVSSLQNTVADIQERSTFHQIADDLTRLDSDLNHALNLLESARDRGYVYQNDLEDIAYQATDRWQTIQHQLEAGIQNQSQMFQANIQGLNPYIQRLNSVIQNPTLGASTLGSTQDQVNRVLWDLEKAESSLEDQYEQIEESVHQLNARLTTIHWALDQLVEAKFSLTHGEDLVMGTPARWDKEGKDDPEGVLYLSNKRVVFEQKEKIATKKVLFITTASELVQQVLIDQGLDSLGEIKSRNKGIFGHQDFMDVEFLRMHLKTVSFHLNGQDSQEWANLIKRAQSGDIEKERATGSGLSFADLSGPLTSADLMAMQNEVNELQDEMMLKDIQNEMAELENDVHSLQRDLAGLRAAGYAVEKKLEADVTILVAQWDRIKTRVEATLKHQTDLLSEQMGGIQKSLAALMGQASNLGAARAPYIRLKSAIASAEAQADAAEDTVLDQYDAYADEVESLSTHFDWVDWMLTALSTASFRLLATESGVAATEALWERPGLEPENGILYLTDQRILWEDRAGAYELKISVPLQEVGEVNKSSNQDGEFEVLIIAFENQTAPVASARFQLGLPVANDWLKMVGRARAGDYLQDRAIEVDQDQLDRIRNAPDQCPNCGAGFTSPVLRGQNEMVCEYCGVTTRI